MPSPRTFVLLLLLAWFAQPGFGQTPSLDLEFGIGSETGCFGIFSPREGPESGPLSVVSTEGGGFAALDVPNSRVQFFDPDGRPGIISSLPPGKFTDLAAAPDGTFWIMDGKNRTISLFNGTEWGEAFQIPSGAGFPSQLDLLACTGKNLAILDFAGPSLYWFSREGQRVSGASIPTALGIIPTEKESVMLLALGEEDEYNRLLEIDSTGNPVSEKKLEGEGFSGARLLSILNDGRAVVLGNKSEDPFLKELFTVSRSGEKAVLAGFSAKFRFSSHLGGLTGKTLWLNVSRLGESLVRIRRISLD